MRAATPQRPVLAGNGKAAIDVLDLMLQLWAPEQILVIAPPRGPLHYWQPSLADHAKAHRVAVAEPDDVNQDLVVSALRHRTTDLLLSVYYTQVFSVSLLDVVKGKRLNFHPSLLPRHRGTAPLIWAIAEGDDQTGVTVHELTRGIDTGPILWQRPLPIHRDDTGYILHLKAAALVRAIAADLFRRLRLSRHLPEPVAQTGKASVHSTRDPQLNRIDWTQQSSQIRNIVRALAWPLPGAETTWGRTVIGIDEVTVTSEASAQAPGQVEMSPHQGLTVCTGSGAVRLDHVRIDGERRPAQELITIGIGTGDLFR